MSTTKQMETKYGIARLPLTADRARPQQRPLAKAYRLILSYEPKNKATAQGEGGQEVPQPDTLPSALE